MVRALDPTRKKFLKGVVHGFSKRECPFTKHGDLQDMGKFILQRTGFESGELGKRKLFWKMNDGGCFGDRSRGRCWFDENIAVLSRPRFRFRIPKFIQKSGKFPFACSPVMVRGREK